MVKAKRYFRSLSAVLVITVSALLGRRAQAQANVHFERGDKPSVVVVEGNQCTSPCTMFLAAGAHTIKIDGDAVDVKVPVTSGSVNANFRSNLDIFDVAGGSAVAGVGLIASSSLSCRQVHFLGTTTAGIRPG